MDIIKKIPVIQAEIVQDELIIVFDFDNDPDRTAYTTAQDDQLYRYDDLRGSATCDGYELGL